MSMIMTLYIHDCDDEMTTVYNLLSYEMLWMFIYFNECALLYSFIMIFFSKYELFICNVNGKNACEDVSLLSSHQLQ